MNMFSYLKRSAVLLMLTLSLGAGAEELKYYMDFEEALAATPQKETKQLSAQVGRDVSNYPIPWKQQIRNAITNAGFSDTKNQSDDNEFWIPFDKIPGEDAFPMQKRLSLSSRRGYQRSIIKGMIESEREIAANSQVFKDIAEKHKKESEDSLAALLASMEASKSSNRNKKKKAEQNLKDQDQSFYERECKFYFPADAGGCGILASSIVQGSLIDDFTVHLSDSAKGGNLLDGDVFISFSGGRLVARDDQGGWVQWYKYDDKTSERIAFNRAK